MLARYTAIQCAEIKTFDDQSLRLHHPQVYQVAQVTVLPSVYHNIPHNSPSMARQPSWMRL